MQILPNLPSLIGGIDNEMDTKVCFVADNLVEFIKLLIANQKIEEKRLD